MWIYSIKNDAFGFTKQGKRVQSKKYYPLKTLVPKNIDPLVSIRFQHPAQIPGT